MQVPSVVGMRVKYLRCFLPGGCGSFHPTAVVAKSHVHEDFPAGGVETHYQGFGIFAALTALIVRMLGGGADVKVESLIVESGDGIADDLVG